jgi:hypothetical protein
MRLFGGRRKNIHVAIVSGTLELLYAGSQLPFSYVRCGSKRIQQGDPELEAAVAAKRSRVSKKKSKEGQQPTGPPWR